MDVRDLVIQKCCMFLLEVECPRGTKTRKLLFDSLALFMVITKSSTLHSQIQAGWVRQA